MEEQYSRNRLYVKEEEQNIIKDFSILLAGCGIGSNIAECALRFGFENITLVDGDTIELSNLNRQNYTYQDVSSYKAETLYHRLKSINPNANIRFHSEFINKDNVSEIIGEHDIAINALDFSSDIPIVFDKICQEKNIPVLHPYNLGWGALVMVISESIGLDSLQKAEEKFNEVSVVQYVSSHMRYWGNPQKWLEDVVEQYLQENKQLPPPQLSIASFLAAASCVKIAFNIATQQPVKKFPDFYLTTVN
ncbi:ThiF family adenylyltransferase [Chryseobacterium lactis]|uniref:ThiF family adenylyltransferase n=1 Tax=Chryseobacterium lactis TaxID=1241981 RepID=UPI0016262AA5|nr:ThiF family adenylyltransferase [Chryseobacterium lactis]